MTKQKAITILNKQIVKLESKNFHHPIWNIQTKTYLEKFFGKDSEQHKFFHVRFWNIDSLRSKGITIETKKFVASSFLSDCIDTIDDIGLNKADPKGNFLSRQSDRMILFWLGVLFSGGLLLGRIIYKVFECG